MLLLTSLYERLFEFVRTRRATLIVHPEGEDWSVTLYWTDAQGRLFDIASISPEPEAAVTDVLEQCRRAEAATG